MVIEAFPPLESADEYGLLAVGGDVEVESLLLAYQSGIFPWPIHENLLTWFAPPKRTILFFEEIHVPRKLDRFLRIHPFELCFNCNFDEVIDRCSEVVNRGDQEGTWITRELIKGYKAFHRAGYAHSIEAYHEGVLVGGLYGVAIGGMFAGESMFYRKSGASKVALFHLIEHLRAHGVKWLDCQSTTPLLTTLGARDIDRREFMELLEESLAADTIIAFPKKN